MGKCAKELGIYCYISRKQFNQKNSINTLTDGKQEKKNDMNFDEINLEN